VREYISKLTTDELIQIALDFKSKIG